MASIIESPLARVVDVVDSTLPLPRRRVLRVGGVGLGWVGLFFQGTLLVSLDCLPHMKPQQPPRVPDGGRDGPPTLPHSIRGRGWKVGMGDATRRRGSLKPILYNLHC